MDEDAFFQDLLHAVEQQLAAPQTRYVAKTLERLTAKGMSEDDAKARIAACLGEETDAMWRSKKGFDEKSYREKLDGIDASERFDDEEE
ncbi:hypothetical protein OKA04_00900 [Luteolibacter flavescens]|uniref:Uncharacterized protein n=1 Tax=Luteolibacter flavescens TaxID=1859460 RepID=A0ABT3FIA6_9BACT|nr:hypothetical protein [Luteolibacter flavescens]MCW1883265.1 hypothetical protein [Luteolibacter flavescens]